MSMKLYAVISRLNVEQRSETLFAQAGTVEAILDRIGEPVVHAASAFAKCRRRKKALLLQQFNGRTWWTCADVNEAKPREDRGGGGAVATGGSRN